MPAKGAFHHSSLGRYHPGVFYSEAFSGVCWELDFLFPHGVGREDHPTLQHCVAKDIRTTMLVLPVGFPKADSRGGPHKTTRLVVLLHETSHFIHDLSLGAFLVCDSVLDLTSFILFDCVRKLSSEGDVRCPLLSPRLRFQWDRNAELADAFSIMIDAESCLERIMNVPVVLATDVVVPLCGIPVENAVGLSSFCGRSLAESVVAVKTLVALAARVKDAEDVSYLERYKSQIPILPEDLPEDYSGPRAVFHVVVRHVLGLDKPLSAPHWPRDYSDSLIRKADVLFVLIGDFALHIPPYQFIHARIAEGRNCRDDFYPANRFSRALNTILRDKRAASSYFSVSVPDYPAIFDWIAANQQAALPTIRETNEAWRTYLGFKKRTRREASDGFKFRTLVERDERWYDLIVGDSLLMCWKLWLPVFHLTPTGFKTLSASAVGDRLYIHPYETPDLAPLDFFFTNYGLWTDAGGAGPSKMFEGQAENELILRQEVVYRSICRELQRAMFYNSFASCPFANDGCRAATKYCSRITSLGATPTNGCVVREYLKQKKIDPSRIVWT